MRDDAIVGTSPDGTVLDVLIVVLEAFRLQAVSCCYWKSTRRVHEILHGEADLDLLIARGDQHLAQKILLDHGLKLCPSVATRDHPAITSFLGYDAPSGRIVHLHLHFRLILGERLLKNYRLPWEAALLANAIPHPTLPLRTLDPASEAVLLAVRACLELGRLDPVTVRGLKDTRQKFELDREALAGQVDRHILRDRANALAGEDLADPLVGAMYCGQPFQYQRRLRRLVRKRMAVYRSHNMVEARLRSVGRVVTWLAGGINKRFLHFPRPWGRRAPGGGCVVALVGVDGSGKTTVVACIREWLGAELDVIPIYFGTGGGRPSLLLLPLKLMVPLIERLFASKPKGSSHGTVSDRSPGVLYSVCLAVWATVLAIEKRHKLIVARRGAERGIMVIADRYPQDEIADFNDAPLLPRLARVPQWLRGFETAAYGLAQRLPPDLILKLEASPGTISRREPDMDPTVVQKRTAALRRLAFPGAKVVGVDAEQPLADVIRAVKHEIWKLL